MAEGFHEEGIVPAGAFDFAPYGCGVGVGSQDVEGEPAQNGEVLGSIVLPRPIAILGEMDVKHPMELVLDGPVTAGDVQQPLRRHVFGQEKWRTTGGPAPWSCRRLREVIRPTAATPGNR